MQLSEIAPPNGTRRARKNLSTGGRILPSFVGDSCVVIEAMACGIPVVATNVGELSGVRG